MWEGGYPPPPAQSLHSLACHPLQLEEDPPPTPSPLALFGAAFGGRWLFDRAPPPPFVKSWIRPWNMAIIINSLYGNEYFTPRQLTLNCAVAFNGVSSNNQLKWCFRSWFWRGRSSKIILRTQFFLHSVMSHKIIRKLTSHFNFKYLNHYTQPPLLI